VFPEPGDERSGGGSKGGRTVGRGRSFEMSRAAVQAFSLVLLLGASLVFAAKPPEKKTYFTILVGLDAPYSWDADCLSFTSTEMCTSDGLCGSWTFTETGGSETGFAFEIDDEENGGVRIDGNGRIDDRGKNDSLAGAARAREGGQSVNFSFTGRSTKRKKCSRLLAEWRELAGVEESSR
jgi:hypothetical protein